MKNVITFIQANTYTHKFRFMILSGIVIGVLAFLAYIIPIKRINAQWYNNGETEHYTCDAGRLTVTLSPDTETSCDTSYQSTAKLIIHGNGNYHVVWGVASFFCSTPSNQCLENFISNGNTEPINFTNGVAEISLPSAVNQPDQSKFPNQACGDYQNDFGFYIYRDDNPTVHLCSTTNPNDIRSLGSLNNYASWCSTGTTCAIPTPTPTTAPTATPTTVPTATPTTVPTATPTTVPTATPTTVPTMTPTVFITPTTPIGCGQANYSNNTNVNCNNQNQGQDQTQGQIQDQNQGQGQQQSQTTNVDVNNSNTNNNTYSPSNNNDINISLDSYAPPAKQQSQQIEVAPASSATSLPNTGMPFEETVTLFSMSGIGFLIRKFTNWS